MLLLLFAFALAAVVESAAQNSASMSSKSSSSCAGAAATFLPLLFLAFFGILRWAMVAYDTAEEQFYGMMKETQLTMRAIGLLSKRKMRRGCNKFEKGSKGGRGKRWQRWTRTRHRPNWRGF
jgi:hypothetical protein